MSEEEEEEELSEAQTPQPFDFDSHRATAEESYRRTRGVYEDFAAVARRLLVAAIETESITVHSVEARAKTVESLGLKAARPSEKDPEQPKYPNPLDDIEDLAGCRVITFFLKNVDQIDKLISSQFEVLDRANRSAFLRGGERLGYESVHYVVRIHPDRLQWPEYVAFTKLKLEIQVRTILQHAWAEIEHDVQYKSADELPSTIRRRFLALAGMLEIGDREFQAIADSHEQLRAAARTSVAEGRLSDVEITPESLKDYLDRKFGRDGRMREFSYSFQTRVLKQLGFTNLDQLDQCIKPYNADRVSRIINKTRQGQLTRLEEVLLASMGENYISRHPWHDSTMGEPEWFVKWSERRLKKLQNRGVQIGNFDPVAKGGEQ